MVEIQDNISLKKLNTFAIQAFARKFCTVRSVSDLCELYQQGWLNNEKPKAFLVLGGGSNLLFTENFEGLIAHIQLKGIQVQEQNETEVYVKAAAGEDWPTFVDWCVEKGYGGLENLSLIPGLVGSCPVQNIGAYGAEVKDVITLVETFDTQTSDIVNFTNEQCSFGYRESVFKHQYKGRYIILSVTFKLSLQPLLKINYGAISQELTKNGISNPDVSDVSRAVKSIRQTKLPDPKELGSAGSFFKNPTIAANDAANLKQKNPEMVMYQAQPGFMKLAAGWMIEQCGWKGYRVGYAGVHFQQALVLVNYGNASGKEVVELSEKIRDSVYSRFGVMLETEVNII
jgi:UDP-N-acetylmuramate dehydrogenase